MQVENQPHADERIAHQADARIDDAAVALAAENRADFEHLVGDIGLADRRAMTNATVPRRDVLRHARGGHVDDHRAALAAQTERHRQRQRQLLADVTALLVDQSQSIRVGIESETDVRALLDDKGTNIAQVLGGRFRLVQKYAIARRSRDRSSRPNASSSRRPSGPPAPPLASRKARNPAARMRGPSTN